MSVFVSASAQAGLMCRLLLTVTAVTAVTAVAAVRRLLAVKVLVEGLQC